MGDINVKQNLEAILSSINKEAEKARRNPKDIKLVAVSKFHSEQSVIAALEAGQTLFGENRIQEAAAKFDKVREKYTEADLHIIGSLQRNKVKEAVRIATCIESVDRLELIKEIEKQCAKINKQIDILLEMHTGEESKAGFVNEEEMKKALAYCAEGNTPHIIPQGFMTMAPFTENEKSIRKSFIVLRQTAESLKKYFPQMDLNELSMGMSADYKTAISEGSTIVRIGTAIFGQRDYSFKS